MPALLRAWRPLRRRPGAATGEHRAAASTVRTRPEYPRPVSAAARAPTGEALPPVPFFCSTACGLGSFLRLATADRLERGLVIGLHDPGDELMADHVLGREYDMADPLDAVEQTRRLGQPGGLPVGQVDLARVAGHDHAAVLAEPRQKHLHLHRGRVLPFVEDDDRVSERAAAHEGEWRDLEFAGLHRALDDTGIHQVVEGVVDRPQIGIDLLAHVPGQEAEPLAGLDRGPRQDDAVDLLALEQLYRMRDGEPGLAGARGSGAEDERMPPQRADIGVLRGGARAHRALAQIDLLEVRPRARRVVVEQRALCDREPDRAFDVAGDEFVAALEPRIEAVKHAARLLAGVA